MQTINRHHHEADAMQGRQKLEWEWEMNEIGMIDHHAKPDIPEIFVPRYEVIEDYDNFDKY